MVTPKINNSSKRTWQKYFSIVFAIVLLFLVLQNISFEEIKTSIATLDTELLLIAFALNMVVVLLMAFRWRILYNVINTPPPYGRLVKVTVVSIFFNTILPSVIGGDTYRTLNLGRHENNSVNMERSFAIVFVDRIIGLIALMMLGCFGLVFNSILDIPPIVSILTISLLLFFIIVLLLSMDKNIYKLLINSIRWLPSQYVQRIDTLLLRVQSNISVYRNHKLLLIEGIIISFAQRFCWLFSGYYVAVALHLDITVMTFILFLPIIEIIRLIPLTIQGIGVREGLFILFFGSVGVSNSDAVLLATIIYLLPSLIGVFGGGIYLFDQLQTMRSRHQVD